MENKKIFRYFSKEKLNDYEKEKGFLSYANLFGEDTQLILCNEIVKQYEFLELEHGTDYDEENDTYIDIYQYYIIDDYTARLLKEYTQEIIFYHNELDIYILGVTHFGTSWNYILTDIKLEKINENRYKAYIEEE